MNKKLGWIKEKEDKRDKISLKYLKISENDIPNDYDLSNYFTSVEDQSELGSCTANAAAGIVEYYEKNFLGKYLNLSRLFTYKVTRNLEKSIGDVGATIRGTLGSLRVFGACPETYYKYHVSNYDKEPSSFHYALAQNYKSIDYYRIDKKGDLIQNIKQHIASNIPVICGISVYENFEDNQNGDIEDPIGKLLGGHAIVLCGYTENRIKFRNSWGSDWGNKGYGTLSTNYIKNYGADFWILSKINYVDLKEFL